MKRGHYRAAYDSLLLLRAHPILAAKELFYVHCQMEVEDGITRTGRHHAEPHKSTANEDGVHDSSQRRLPFTKLSSRLSTARPINYWQKLAQLFSIPRNRRAIIAAVVCMISQQFCGINVLAFFSSTFFCSAGDPRDNGAGTYSLRPLYFSWGFGLANFIFTFPAYFFIDTKGRRWLLLITLPFMAISMLAAGLSFLIPDTNPAHVAVIVLWTFVFVFFYSWGMGPVPFTLSAEVLGTESRVVGMSFSVFCNLFGAGLLALFVPALTAAIGHTGLLGIFAFLNVVSFILVFFFVRETAGAAVEGTFGSMISVSLEELNYIFAVPTAKHAVYQLKTVLPWAWRYYVKRDKTCHDQPEKLYTWASARDREMQEMTHDGA